jgi:hypothetical protein
VFIHLKPYNQNSLKAYHFQNISPKFYVPCTIIKCIGTMDYKLALSIHSKIHPFFHVACLKKLIRSECHVQMNLPKLDEEGSIWLKQKVLILDQMRSYYFPAHSSGSFNTMEGYTSQRCYMGAILQQFPHLKP